MNAHPGFWSSRVFHTQMMMDIEQQYSAHPEILKTYGLRTEYSNVDMYFSRRKINAEYSLNGKDQRINTDAFMVYAPRDNVDTAMVYLAKISSLGIAKSSLYPMFIPMVTKYSNHVKFGQYAAQHNAFLNNHRNIAIVGLHPIAMDTDLPNGRNSWAEIAQLPGVYRCDPCRRTHNLGKWNISCEKAFHPNICACWLDENLVNLCSQLPGKTSFPSSPPF
jgi:hypothetical protein